MLVAFAQKPYKVVFYNLENLFDTINDPNKNDEELPQLTLNMCVWLFSQVD